MVGVSSSMRDYFLRIDAEQGRSEKNIPGETLDCLIEDPSEAANTLRDYQVKPPEGNV